MFGWIMPAPFVMPAIEKVVLGEEGRVKVWEASLRNVSVVHIPLAAWSQCSWELPMPSMSFGMLLIISLIGSLLLHNFGVQRCFHACYRASLTESILPLVTGTRMLGLDLKVSLTYLGGNSKPNSVHGEQILSKYVLRFTFVINETV